MKILQVVISTCLLLLVFQSLDLGLVIDSITEIDGVYLSVCFGLIIIGIFLSSKKWLLIIRAVSGKKIAFSSVLRFYWLGKLYSMILPLGISGEITRFLYLQQHEINLSKIKNLNTILLDKGTGVLSLLAISGALIYSSKPGVAAIPLAVCFLGILALYFFEELLKIFDLLMKQCGFDFKVYDKFEFNFKAAVTTSLIYGFGFQLVVLAFLYFLLMALNIPVTLFILGVIQLLDLVASIPFSFQGLGVRELLLLNIVANDTNYEIFAAFGLVVFFLNLVASLPAIFYIRSK